MNPSATRPSEILLGSPYLIHDDTYSSKKDITKDFTEGYYPSGNRLEVLTRKIKESIMNDIQNSIPLLIHISLQPACNQYDITPYQCILDI